MTFMTASCATVSLNDRFNHMTKSSDQTRERILQAALECLRQEGFAGATSRAIAGVGGFNQALIFYHYGSLDALLLAALDRTSKDRLAHYRAALRGIETLDELLRVARNLYEEDRRSGHMTVVSQMIAGSLARPDLAPRVLAKMQPWLDLAEQTIKRLVPPLLPAGELAYAAVTFYLGVNLLAHLAPDDDRLGALFESAEKIAPALVGRANQA
jgi:AcrR family transcriptional regulator